MGRALYFAALVVVSLWAARDSALARAKERSADDAYWEGLRDQAPPNDVPGLAGYLASFPNGRFANAARQMFAVSLKQWENAEADRQLALCGSVDPRRLCEYDSSVREIYFDAGSARVKRDVAITLAQNAETLKRVFSNYPELRCVIEGYVSPGTRNATAIGQQRAEAVKRFLVMFGVHPDRLKIMSYGTRRLVCVEKGDSCRQQNDRVHFAAAQP